MLSDQEKNSFVDDIIELFEFFLDREQPLFHEKVGELGYWHYIRFQFILEILNLKGWTGRGTLWRQSTIPDKAAILWSLSNNSLLHGIDKDKKRTELLVLNSTRRQRLGSQYVDYYTEIWLPALHLTYSFWEAPFAWRHKPHEGGEGLFFLDSLLVRTLVGRRLTCTSPTIRTEIQRLIEFAAGFGVRMPYWKIRDMLMYVVSLHAQCAALIARKLRAKQPRLIFLVNHYDPLKMLITSIAKSMAIYVVEFQHGTMGRYHVAYNFKYSEPLPALPDEIFTFGRFWNETARLTQNGVKLSAVGLPAYERQIRNENVHDKGKKKRVLFISQDTIGSELARAAASLASLVDNKIYEICYKLHPREYRGWKSRYPMLDSEVIRVYAETDLYALLRSADVHVGVYSTTVIESLVFNRQLILYETYGVHFFMDLIRSGRAVLARNVEELFQCINSDDQQPKDYGKDLSYYWEMNSEEKVMQRIEQILAAR